MKILKIEFENINSLKGAHQIDFSKTPFTASSLFAITGPTGSGKSSILDVISLALFNHVPRLGKISKNEILNKGALLTRNQKEARAKITYECNSGIFSSEWSISTNRNNKLRDYEMIIFDVASEKALDLKKSDVPAKNEELIGLNYEQFIKAVLLAQGEFAQFLKARKDERGELLEKLTGTGIYRQLGVRAFQKKKEVTAEIEQQQKEIQLLQKDLLEPEDLQKLNSQLTASEENCSLLEKTINKLEQNIRLKKSISEQVSQINFQQKRKETAQTALASFESEFGLPLRDHEKVNLFGDDLRLWKQLDEACKELSEEKIKTTNRNVQNGKNISDCLEKIGAFIGRTSTLDHVESDLQTFSKKVQQLQSQKEEKRNLFQNLQERFQLEVRDIPFQLNGDLEKSHQKLVELHQEAQKKVEQLKKELSDLDLESAAAEKQRLKKDLEKARRAQQQSQILQNISSEIVQLEEDQKLLAPKLEKLPQEISSTQDKNAVFGERLEKLKLKRENEMLRKSLQEHRHQLKNGEPCPLCGALEHPFATDLPTPEDGLHQQIKETEKEFSALREKVAALQANLQHYTQQMQVIKKKILERQQELESQKCAFKEVFGESYSAETKDWQTKCSQYDQKINQLESYEQENRRLTAIAAGVPLLVELQEVLQQGKQLKTQLDGLYTGKDIGADCLQLQTSWTGFQHEQKSLANFMKDLDLKFQTKEEQLKKLEIALSPRIKEGGCKDVLEALKKLLPEQQYSGLRKKKEELSKEISGIQTTLETLSQQLQLLKEKDETRSSEELTSEMEDSLKTLKAAKSECEEVRRIIRNDSEDRDKIANIQLEISKKSKNTRRWELLNQLIGDATGKKFNDFAQDLNLAQLLRLANLRLKDLSDRYILDKPTEEEDDGLVAIDEHMGGQRRSVKTLSGGETFILSLSMALALSDLASKNVEINSLFIDEGFGTLDPETLDQTLDTLEKLQAESSKTIGIISHVDSLKERIGTQIQLKRNGQGFSSLELKG